MVSWHFVTIAALFVKSLCATPFTYLAVKRLKRAEGIDVYGEPRPGEAHA